jgi:hypothetical protein
VRRALYAFRGVFLDALDRQLQGEADALGGLDPQLNIVPQSFLAYVAPGAPGHSLVQTADLDKYLYTGESVHHKQDTRLLESFRDLAKAKQLVREVRTRAADPEVQAMLEELRELAERISYSVREYAKGPVAPIVASELRLLKDRIPYAPTDSSARRAWFEEQGRLLDRVQDNLMSLYDLAPLSGL